MADEFDFDQNVTDADYPYYNLLFGAGACSLDSTIGVISYVMIVYVPCNCQSWSYSVKSRAVDCQSYITLYSQ